MLTHTQLLAELEAVRFFLEDQAAMWEAKPWAEPSHTAVALRIVREAIRPAARRLARLLKA